MYESLYQPFISMFFLRIDKVKFKANVFFMSKFTTAYAQLEPASFSLGSIHTNIAEAKFTQLFKLYVLILLKFIVSLNRLVKEKTTHEIAAGCCHLGGN